MNDEPHSHKKATVALMAVLLLAYVGSYLWFRQGPSRGTASGFRVLWRSDGKDWYPSARFLDRLYWPLRKLDRLANGEEVVFLPDVDWASAFLSMPD